MPAGTVRWLSDRPCHSFGLLTSNYIVTQRQQVAAALSRRRDHTPSLSESAPTSQAEPSQQKPRNPNASRSSGEGVWGRGASLREAASPPESPSTHVSSGGSAREGASLQRSPLPRKLTHPSLRLGFFEVFFVVAVVVSNGAVGLDLDNAVRNGRDELVILTGEKNVAGEADQTVVHRREWTPSQGGSWADPASGSSHRTASSGSSITRTFSPPDRYRYGLVYIVAAEQHPTQEAAHVTFPAAREMYCANHSIMFSLQPSKNLLLSLGK